MCESDQSLSQVEKTPPGIRESLSRGRWSVCGYDCVDVECTVFEAFDSVGSTDRTEHCSTGTGELDPIGGGEAFLYGHPDNQRANRSPPIWGRRGTQMH